MREIIGHLLEMGMVEQVGKELIVGVDGEFIVNHRNFYSVFQIEAQFKVIHAGNAIGEVPFSAQFREGENILLAARVWTIWYVDEKSRKIEVMPAADGKRPVFSGGGGVIHPRIREKMLEVLFESGEIAELEEKSREALRELRSEFSVFPVKSQEIERPLWRTETSFVDPYPFAGTKVNRTLVFLLGRAGLHFFADEGSGCLEGDQVELNRFYEVWSLLGNELSGVEEALEVYLQENPGALGFSKWGVIVACKISRQAFDDAVF